MMPNTFKRILSAVMALVLMVALLPAAAVTAEAADSSVVDAAIFFSDLHSQKNNYKESTISSVFGAVKNTGLPVSSVTSVGDAFSVNYDNDWFAGQYTGYTSRITTEIQKLFNVPVNYVWSDHDRYAVQEDGETLLDKTSRLVYGDESTNYYVYALSMADISSDDRYGAGFGPDADRAGNGFTATVRQAIINFRIAAAGMDKSKPLFITSHQPLLHRRGDNANALAWARAINEVAEEMDVVFLHGHNHKYDVVENGINDYYYAKGSTMPVCTGEDTYEEFELEFTHMNTGYLAPDTTGSTSDTTRKGCVIVATITDDSIQLNTYNASGKFTGTYSVSETIARDCTNPHVHTFTSETVHPTCTVSGYTLYTCQDCGNWYVGDETDALGHDYVDVVTAPTAETQGYTTHTCQRCYHSFKDSFVAATGHNYQVTVIAPTCTTSGYTSHICLDCGKRFNDNYTSALGHNYEITVVDPVCAENGYTKHTCTICGDTYKDNYIIAPGHNYTEVVTKPTCTELGYSTFTCVDCGTITIGNYVAEAGHLYDCVLSGNMLIYTCKNCDHSYSVVKEADYIYNKVSKLVNGDTYVITLYSGGKYYALSHKNNRISVTPVTVANNKVTSEVTEDLLWTHNNKKLSYDYYGMNYYLNATSSKLSISTSASAAVSYSSNKLKVGTNYLRYASNSVTMNRTATTTYLFNQVEN